MSDQEPCPNHLATHGFKVRCRLPEGHDGGHEYPTKTYRRFDGVLTLGDDAPEDLCKESFDERLALAESRVGETATRTEGDYTIAMVRDFSHTVSFKVYEVFSRDLDGNILDWKNDDQASAAPAVRLEDASVFVHGNVKWDGCINFSFDAQKRGCLHFCGPRDALGLAPLFLAVFQMAAKLMPDVCDFMDEL